MTLQIVTEVGRMVAGHPMILREVKDRNGQVKISTKTGAPVEQVYVALAVPKNGTTDWRQTPWGAQIYAAAQQAWPGGEFNYPSFAWKITDGDSNVPNKRGVAPCEKEGYPGHWVIHATNGWPANCVADGNYQQEVTRPDRFKPGDYARIQIGVKTNGANTDPGMYLNLMAFELIRAGREIVSNHFDGQGVFGAAGPAQLPPGAELDTTVHPQPGGYQPPAQPAAQPGGYQQPAQPAAQPGGYQPPAQPAAQPGGYQPPAQPAAQLGGYQPPAQPAAQPGGYQPPAQPAAQPGGYQPPAQPGGHPPQQQDYLPPRQ